VRFALGEGLSGPGSNPTEPAAQLAGA
jgi:hypothetical protein